MRRGWFRQARTPLLTACGRVAKSARCCPSRPSRRFAKRAMESWVLHSQGTIAFCLHTLRTTVQTVFPSCAPVCPRGSLLDGSRLLGLTLRHSAPVCCCHQDSLTRWRLAFAQPRVLLLLRLPICSFESRCALWFLTACEECPFKRCGRMKVLLPSIFFFHTLCYLSVFSLTVLDHQIGIRLEAPQKYFVLVLWVSPSWMNDSHVLP